MSKKKSSKRIIGRIHGTYTTQPISSPDARAEKSGIAMPNQESVIANKEWVDENHK